MAQELSGEIGILDRGQTLSHGDADRIVAFFVRRIRETLLEGGAVGLMNVGSLVSVIGTGRNYRHPVTGELQSGATRNVRVRFLPSRNFREQLRQVMLNGGE